MAIFDYSAEAELSPTATEEESFPARRAEDAAAHRIRPISRAADALRVAIEELLPALFLAVQLKVAEQRFDGQGIRRVYESVEYPLARRAVSRRRMRQVVSLI